MSKDGEQKQRQCLLSLCLQGQGDISSAPTITAGLLTNHHVLPWKQGAALRYPYQKNECSQAAAVL